MIEVKHVYLEDKEVKLSQLDGVPDGSLNSFLSSNQEIMASINSMVLENSYGF